jgi:hypothetical protein
MQQHDTTESGMVIGGNTIGQTKGRVLTMAVLIEAISVVIRLVTIAEKYPGGVEQYVKDSPNRTLCMDDSIARLGFMTGRDAQDFIESLERLGFRCAVDGEFDEIAVVDQFDGLYMPCDWLEYLKLVIFEGDIRVSICKSKGNPIGDVVFPCGWNYEKSLSKRTLPMDSRSLGDRLIFLKHKDGVDCYRDALTGEEVFITRTISRNTNA